jgi:hypothetical protein
MSKTRGKPGENAAVAEIPIVAARDLKVVQSAPEHSSFASLLHALYPFQHSFAS